MPRFAPIAGISLASLLLLNVAAADARDLPTAYAYWDLDTLVYEADAVVEGRFIQRELPGIPHSAILRVTAVHCGTLTVGQSVVVTRADQFFKPYVPAGRDRLDAGDHLFLFLVKTRESAANRALTAMKMFTRVAPGTRIVVRGRVCSFDYSATNAFFDLSYFRVPPANAPGGLYDTLPTVTEFRGDIQASRTKTSAWHDCFARPPNTRDIPMLLALLRERSRPAHRESFNDPDDLPAIDAGRRLVEIHDRAVIEIGRAATRELFGRMYEGPAVSEDRNFLMWIGAMVQQPSQSSSELSGGPWRMKPSPLPTPPAWPLLKTPQVLKFIGAILLLPFLLIFRAFIRSRRQRARMRKGLCVRCGYDLRMSTGRCSECGRPRSQGVERGMVRRCAMAIACVPLLLICAASMAMWIRSHYVTDCLTCTAAERTDSYYAARGAVLVQLMTIDGPPGWSYDRGDPAGFPRTIAECGDLEGRRFLGIEYSTGARLVVVPCAWVTGISGGLAVLLILRVRRQRDADRDFSYNSTK